MILILLRLKGCGYMGREGVKYSKIGAVATDVKAIRNLSLH
jgi:hypothetical protein